MTTAQAHTPDRTARLMDGTALARRISKQTAAQAAKLTERTGTAPVWRPCWSARTRRRSPTYA